LSRGVPLVGARVPGESVHQEAGVHKGNVPIQGLLSLTLFETGKTRKRGRDALEGVPRFIGGYDRPLPGND
jgi:hypothetical protein